MSSDSYLILFSTQPSLGFGLYSFSKVVFLIIEEVTSIEDTNLVCKLTTTYILEKNLYVVKVYKLFFFAEQI